MSIVLIANIIALIGAIIMVAIGLIKSKKQILLTQSIQFAIMGLSNYLLGGITGVISNLVGILRNLVTLKWPFTIPWKLTFIAIQFVLSAGTNELGLIGWLPVIAGCSFTWFLDTKNEIVLKAVIIFTSVLWAIFDINIQNYTTAVFDILAVFSNAIGICILHRRKTQPKTPKES